MSHDNLAQVLLAAAIPAAATVLVAVIAAVVSARGSAHTTATDSRRQAWDEMQYLLAEAKADAKDANAARLDAESELERVSRAYSLVISRLRAALRTILKKQEDADPAVILTQEHREYLDLLRVSDEGH